MISSGVHLFLALLLAAAFSSNEVESQCSKQDYQRCVNLAEPLLKDPHLIYPDNMEDIESVCRTWTYFVECVKDYTERCFTEARRQEFNKAIESPVSSIHKLCSSPEYREDYLKHATCMKMTLTQDNMCGRHYRRLVSLVSGEAPPADVCCAHHLLRECVIDQTKRSCDPESSPYASSMLDKALSFLREQCANYVPNQAECPGADFYKTTSPSLPAANKDYSVELPLIVKSTSSGVSVSSQWPAVTSSLPMPSPSAKPLSTMTSPMTSSSTSADSKTSGSSYHPEMPSSTRSEPAPWSYSSPVSTASDRQPTGRGVGQHRPTMSSTAAPGSWKGSSDLWMPGSRPPMLDNSIDEPNQQGLDGSQRLDNAGTRFTSPAFLVTTALALLTPLQVFGR